MTGARPGWYPDPAGADRDPAGVDRGYRWWDGSDWTDAVGDSPEAVAPTHAEAVGGRTARRSARRRAAAFTISIALVAVVGVLLGLVIWRDPGQPGDKAVAGVSPVEPAGSPAGVTGGLDESSRVATIAGISMTLPGDPYVLYSDPMKATGLVDEFFLASAAVHARYAGRQDWSAMVGLAHITLSPGEAGDLDRAATAALRDLAGRFFGGHPTTVTKVSTADRAVDGQPGVLLTAQVHYRIAGLPSRYDAVTALLVRLDDGSVVAAFSSVPNDASPKLRRLAAQSTGSLRVG